VAEKEKTPEQLAMDTAADEADKELRSLPAQSVTEVANWWQKHYLKAGHKRLGQKLLGYIKVK
jgi:hypothetical protein